MLQRFRQYLRTRGLRLRSLLYPLVLLLIAYVVYQCRQVPRQALQGRTMGTAYTIKYLGEQRPGLQRSVDSLLHRFNEALSTYIDHSEISRFNRDGKEVITSDYFYPVLKASKEIYRNTNGAFDPTVGPLVSIWGFGKEEVQVPDTLLVDSLQKLVSFDYIRFDKDKVVAEREGVQLDFSALAKGYGVDLVARMLKDRNIEDFMVEIGGEVVCRGNNANGKPWLMGITNPKVEEHKKQPLIAKIRLKNKAMATSGNYYNYYIEDGEKYVHTIDPRTGYPVQHDLVSATVFGKSCMKADGYATAFMVLGKDSAQKILREQKMLQGYLVYRAGEKEGLKTWYSPQLKKWLTE